MIIKPDLTLKLDCFVNEDFAGLWNNEDQQDSSFLKIRTCFVITLVGHTSINGISQSLSERKGKIKRVNPYCSYTLHTNSKIFPQSRSLRQ